VGGTKRAKLTLRNLYPRVVNIQWNMIGNPVSTSHQVPSFDFVISGVGIDFFLPHASSKGHISRTDGWVPLGQGMELSFGQRNSP
jgi:hypothetical protein